MPPTETLEHNFTPRHIMNAKKPTAFESRRSIPPPQTRFSRPRAFARGRRSYSLNP